MLWGVTTILVGLAVGAWAGEGVEGREGRSMTWAQVANNEDMEYDDSFFKNYDYEYVDAGEVELPPPPERDSPHKLERRTLGYILGSLVDGPEDSRPERSSGRTTVTATPPPSSFLESIMRSIDNFVVEDLKGWSKFLTAMNDRTTTPAPFTTTPPPPAIQHSQGDEEVVVVMDEFGRPQVVTINDIVASLSQLDEQTITELLLGPIDPNPTPAPLPVPAKPVQSGFINAITDTHNRLPERSEARVNHSPTTISPIHSQSLGPTLSPFNSPSAGSTISPNIITSTSGPIISSTRPPTKRPASLNSPHAPIKRPTNFPSISAIRNPTKTPNKTPIDVPNFGAIIGPTIKSPRGPTHDPTQISTHGPTHNPTQISTNGPTRSPTRSPTLSSTGGPTRSPTRSPTQSFKRGPTRGPTRSPTRGPTRSPTQGSTRGFTQNPTKSSKRGSTHDVIQDTFSRDPTRRPTSTIVRAHPTRTLAQSVAQEFPTRSPSHELTRGPTHNPTRSSSQVLVREGSTHTSPSVVRATPIHIPTGVPTRTPGRPDTLPSDFLLPSASRDNTIKQSIGGSVVRPVRHTGPSHGEPPREDEEVVLVRDETGAVHVVTIQDIISSLASLSSENAQDLLFGEAPAPPHTNLNLLQETQKAGSVVQSKVAGGLHAAPRPWRPTSVQDVIAAAEAEELQLPPPAHEVFSVGQQDPHVHVPAPTTPRPTLLDALRQQNIPESIVQHLAAPSILRPVTQAPPVEQPAPGGFGATLRGMLSQFVVGQQHQKQPQQSQAVVGQLGLALPSPIHHQEAAVAFSPNTLQGTTKRSSEDSTLPPALQHLSSGVQAALRQQADNVPNFVPPVAQHAAARADTGPVQYISAEEHDQAKPTPTSAPTKASSKAPPMVLPPAVLKQLPPSVLNKITKQYIEARVGGAPKSAQDRDYYQPVAHYYDYEVHPPVVHLPVHGYNPPAHHGYDHGYDHAYPDYGDLAPMLDIFLLADVTKVHKVGDTNLSVKAPKVGDPSYFVDTRPYKHH